MDCNSLRLTGNNSIDYPTNSSISSEAQTAEISLDKWIKTARPKNYGHYEQAKEKILQAINNPDSKNLMLDLSGLAISTLPDCIIPLLQKGGSLEGYGLKLHNCPIVELPKNLVVEGDLICTGNFENNFLTSLNGLKVEGNLILGVTFIQFMQDVRVGKRLEITDCKNLTKVDSVYVGAGVDFSNSAIETISTLKVEGDLILKHVTSLAVFKNVSVSNSLTITHACITELPASVFVKESLICQNCNELEVIALEHTAFNGDFKIVGCPRLKHLPSSLVVEKELEISHASIQALPSITAGSIVISNLINIVAFPEGAKSLGSYVIKNCLNLTSVKFCNNVIHGDLTLANNSQLNFKWPSDLIVEKNLNLLDTNIRNLPNNFVVNGNLNLNGSKIEQLDGTYVKGFLNVSNCRALKVVQNLNVQEDLFASESGIGVFDETNTVGKSIDFSQSKNLILFNPKDNKVNGSLDLSYTAITTLPPGLEIYGSLDCKNSEIQCIEEGLTILGSEANFRNCEHLRDVSSSTINFIGATIVPAQLLFKGSTNLQNLPLQVLINDEVSRPCPCLINIECTGISLEDRTKFSTTFPLYRIEYASTSFPLFGKRELRIANDH